MTCISGYQLCKAGGVENGKGHHWCDYDLTNENFHCCGHTGPIATVRITAQGQSQLWVHTKTGRRPHGKSDIKCATIECRQGTHSHITLATFCMIDMLLDIKAWVLEHPPSLYKQSMYVTGYFYHYSHSPGSFSPHSSPSQTSHHMSFNTYSQSLSPGSYYDSTAHRTLTFAEDEHNCCLDCTSDCGIVFEKCLWL